jgi:hypothetical protein
LITQPQEREEPNVEQTKLMSWRKDQLRRAGFTDILVDVLATSDADLHSVLDLKKAGCPDGLITDIVL